MEILEAAPPDPSTDPPVATDERTIAALAKYATSIDWYQRQARFSRRASSCLDVILIVTGAAIPMIAVFTSDVRVSAVLGAAVVVATGVRKTFRWGEKTVLWSNTTMLLTQERNKFTFGLGPYAPPETDPVSVFMTRHAQIEEGETRSWADLSAPNQ